MSFILDALKKSEAERQRQRDDVYAEVPLRGEERRQPVWVWILVALLLVNLAVLAGLLLRPSTDTVAETPAVAEPENRRPAIVTEPAAEPQRFEDRVKTALEDRPVRADSAREPEPLVEPATGGSVTVAPVAASIDRPVAPVTDAEPVDSGLPDVNQLRAAGELNVGELRLDIHVFAEQPADRFVFINMVKHREGSTTSDGLVVQEITPQGVILSWRGREFVLPRK